MNKKILLLIAVVCLITVASAAVFATYNPEAKIYFDRPNPDSTVSLIQTLIKTESGGWTNSYGFGTMTGDIMLIEMVHKNTGASSTMAAVYYEIECDEGLPDGSTDGTIKDFDQLVFIDPDGMGYQCNNADCITRLSDTRIRVVPKAAEMGFPSNVYIYTKLNIDFVGMAYGNYTVTALVDKKANIGMDD